MSRQCGIAPAAALSASSALITGTPFTAFSWLKTSDGVEDRQNIFSLGELGTDNFFRARMRITDPKIDFDAEEDGGATGGADTTAGPSVDVWANHCAVSIATDSRDSYLDGANKGSNADTVVPANLDGTEIGQSDDGSPGDRFIGDLGHVAFYGVNLVLGMIETLAAGFNPMRVQRGDLLGYYPLNGQDPERNVMGGVDLSLVGTPPVTENPPIRHFNVAPA
jgi:hypothetical protein